MKTIKTPDIEWRREHCPMALTVQSAFLGTKVSQTELEKAAAKARYEKARREKHREEAAKKKAGRPPKLETVKAFAVSRRMPYTQIQAIMLYLWPGHPCKVLTTQEREAVKAELARLATARKKFAAIAARKAAGINAGRQAG